ncbi:hypothetical protein ABIB25_001616 [Nakamurella sp. UYEF19]
MEHLDPDQLVLLALGEWNPRSAGSGRPALGDDVAPDAHLLACVRCRDELAQLEYTVHLAREAGELGLQADVVLPQSIWSGIAQELGIGSSLAGEAGARNPVVDGSTVVGAQAIAPGRQSTNRRVYFDETGPRNAARESTPRSYQDGSGRPGARGKWRTRRVAIRRGLVTAAVVVAVGIGIGTGLAINGRDTPAAAVQSQAQLAPIDSGSATSHGTAVVTQGTSGLSLHVTARQLPLRQGYYEVWLYNPTADQMVAVGTLGAGGDGVWSLSSAIDLQAYSVVNVSAQDFDGNPAHKSSVLQGPLTQ